MKDWIENLFDEKAAREARIWKRREWTLFCARTIEAHAPGFWEDIKSSCQKSVDLFKDETGLALQTPLPSRSSPDPLVFDIEKAEYPWVRFTAILRLDIQRIDYEMKVTPCSGADGNVTKGRLKFVVEDDGHVYLHTGEKIFGHQDLVSEFLLVPFFNSF